MVHFVDTVNNILGKVVIEHMIEMVAKISQAEEAASLIKKDAAAKAAQLEAEAHKAGKAELAQRRIEQEAQAAKIIAAAQAEANQLGSDQLDTARGESRGLMELASGKLEKAASLIVERIVDTE